MQSLLMHTSTHMAARPNPALFSGKALATNKVSLRKQPAYIKVSYQQFRELMEDQGPTAVKQRGQETHLITRKGLAKRKAAIIKTARIDAQGHCFPTSYYVSSSLIESQALAA